VEFEIGPTIKEENLCGAEIDRICYLKESAQPTPHNGIGYIMQRIVFAVLRLEHWQ